MNIACFKVSYPLTDANRRAKDYTEETKSDFGV